jgi:hypothetical protein
MAVSLKLKAVSILAATCIFALAYIYEPATPAGSVYGSVVKAAAGAFVIAGSILLSAAIGQTFLKNRGRGAFKALYFAVLSSAGTGMAMFASAFTPMNVNVALLALSLVSAIAGVSMFRFFQAGGT